MDVAAVMAMEKLILVPWQEHVKMGNEPNDNENEENSR
jgi:hypothetical protein